VGGGWGGVGGGGGGAQLVEALPYNLVGRGFNS